jgi:predicted NACHT family NTPase
MAKQTGRSLQLSAQGRQKADIALQKFAGKRDLAANLAMSPTTVTNFFAGRPVKRREFHEICKKLRLDWQEVADLPPITESESSEKLQDKGSDIDELVQEVRSLYRDKIQYDCGEMKLLNRQVSIDDLYTDVYILEDIPKLRSLDISERMQGFDPIADDPNRFYLGKVHGERVPGLEIVRDGCKVMCLGAPGSGKTTYLYYVAIQCNKGELQANRVPIFITLSEFTDTIKNQPELSLLNYIENLFHTEGIEQPQAIETIITQGRALILLDGLDEVPKDFSKLVLSRIREFCKYRKNSIIITCRTNALDYDFSVLKFTQVIVADFEQPQIEIFANKWFVAGAKNDKQAGEARAKEFIEKLGLPEHKRIRDLAVTPILLNLTCLIFKNNLGEFPKNRSELYQRGINILLEEWDAERGIERDEVYGKLDLEGRKALLTHVAKVSFEENRYFFKQEEIEKYIADYLRTLPHAQIDSLQRDSRAVLKSIVVQHGLLMERAPEIYSFSHLTFQEYFTAKWFGDRADCQGWEGLVKYITEKHWREVFLLTVEMCKGTDGLLQLMKERVDTLISADKKLQEFLATVNQKSLSIQSSFSSMAIRAFYFILGLPLIDQLINRDDAYLQVLDYVDEFDSNSLDYQLSLTSNLPSDLQVDLSLIIDFDPTLNFYMDDSLRQSLQRVTSILPNLDKIKEWYFDKYKWWTENREWWQVNGQGWTELLRNVVVEHRGISQDWQFSNHQKELLQQYYEANNLLVNCLNSCCRVSDKVRQEIEETLLLPIAEIKKCQRQRQVTDVADE